MAKDDPSETITGFIIYFSLLISYFIFTFFFLSRVTAFIVKSIVNWYCWRQYKTHLQLGSVQISILGGKILFKQLIISNKDFTVNVVEGYISFSYWRWVPYGHVLSAKDPSIFYFLQI